MQSVEFRTDLTAEIALFGLENNSHTTATEPLEDAVVRDRAADQGLGVHHLAGILGRTYGQVNVSPQDGCRIGISDLWLTDFTV